MPISHDETDEIEDTPVPHIVKPTLRQTVKVNGTARKVTPGLWTDAPIEFTRRVTFKLIWGETGTGRTTLALTAPGPIALLHHSEKIIGIIERFAHKIGPHGNGKEGIHNFATDFKGGEDQIKKQATEELDKFRRAWEDALQWAKTLIVDTHTDLWKLVRLARFGKVAQVKPIHYGPVNAEMVGFFNRFREQDRCNIIGIGKAGTVYVNDQATDKMEQAGQKDLTYAADIVVRTLKKKGKFSTLIEKAWMNASKEGDIVELSDEAGFGELMEYITEISADEWM